MGIGQSAFLEITVIDNRAKNIACYCPEYTFVEKLEAISRKFRREREHKLLPSNFIRHHYDVYKLLGSDRIQQFIGSPEYIEHRSKMFPGEAIGSLAINEAFLLSDPETRKRYEEEYNSKAPMYYLDRPAFADILGWIHKQLANL